MAFPGIQSETGKGSHVSCREKRQPWQCQMSDVDFQLSLLAKYAGIEFHPQVLEIILDLIRMNVRIPMLANMMKLMCKHKTVSPSQGNSSNSVNGQNGNTNDGRRPIPSMNEYRTLILSSSGNPSESTSTSHANNSSSSSNNKRNADIVTPSRPNTYNLVTTRPTRTKTAARVVKK